MSLSSFMSFLPAVDRGVKNMRAVCDLTICHNKQLMRSIPGTRPGIQVGAQWYCCVDCFSLAARAPLSSLSQARTLVNPRRPRLPLGLALLSKGSLTAEDLRVTSSQGHTDEDELAEILVRMHLVTEKQVAAARSQQWGYPVFARDFSGQRVFPEIPRALLRACSAVPLHYSASAKRILLGFACRVEHSLLDSIEQITGCRVEPCFITSTDCQEQITRLIVPPNYQEQVISEPGPPEKMARTVGRAAVDVGAREASFGQCKNHIWVRITGKKGKVDILFPQNPILGDEFFKKSGFPQESTTILG
jgi:Type II secretion system (T2SS), protein E, N-terminal domain